jgi:RND family efflux transporter MFP subunit
MSILRLRRIALVLVAIQSGCAAPNKYAPPPPPDVKAGMPQVKAITIYAYFTGNTQASEMVELRAQVQGYLESIHFTDGDDVKQGDLLFVIDPRPYQAKLEQAKADLESSKANEIRAAAIYKRAQGLIESKAASQEEVETKRGDWEVARAAVVQAEAKVKEAKLNLDYTEIHAPISGRISRRFADVGNLVQPNLTVLTTIYRYNPMYVYFTVSEIQHLEYIKKQREQQKLSSGKIAHPVAIGTADEEGYPHEGTIEFADNTVDPGTGTLQIRGSFVNPPPYVLTPGLFVRVRVPMAIQENALLVPEQALGENQGGQYVLVIHPDNVVEQRPVKVGASVDSLRVIEKGLTAGERIVIEGLQQARPGGKVNPK